MKYAGVARTSTDGPVGSSGPRSGEGTREQVERAFFEAFTILDRRIALFLCLPLATLEREVLQSEIDRIGRQ